MKPVKKLVSQPAEAPVFGTASPDLAFTSEQLAALTDALNTWLDEVAGDLGDKRPLVLTPGGLLDLQYTLKSWLSEFTSMTPPSGPHPDNIVH